MGGEWEDTGPVNLEFWYWRLSSKWTGRYLRMQKKKQSNQLACVVINQLHCWYIDSQSAELGFRQEAPGCSRISTDLCAQVFIHAHMQQNTCMCINKYMHTHHGSQHISPVHSSAFLLARTPPPLHSQHTLFFSCQQRFLAGLSTPTGP